MDGPATMTSSVGVHHAGEHLRVVCHGRCPQRTVTVAMSWPSSLITWVEQARQGSKECSVLKISSGFSGSAIGVSSRAASKAPMLPCGSRGETVPGGRNHRLIIVDLAVLDPDPVTERSARGLGEADAPSPPSARYPASTCRYWQWRGHLP